jgi:hypothetical protein
MGTCHSTPIPRQIHYNTFPTYMGAGCLFTDRKMAVAALQRRKGTLSGLGGKRETADADWFDTAWRETAEELFGWDILPPTLLTTLRLHLPVEAVTSNSGYVIVRCSFRILEQFLAFCSGYTSPFYERMPTTLTELLLERNTEAEGEIGGLALLPIHKTPYRLDPLFQVDLLETLKGPSLPLSGRPSQSGAEPSRAPCSSA